MILILNSFQCHQIDRSIVGLAGKQEIKDRLQCQFNRHKSSCQVITYNTNSYFYVQYFLLHKYFSDNTESISCPQTI